MGDQNYDLLNTKNGDVNNFVDKLFEFGMSPKYPAMPHIYILYL